jgi:hypothetical protein
MSKINIFVKSKNKNSDEDSYNFNLIFPNNLIKCKDNETLEMSIVAFSCYNTFFNCNSNTNHFQIIFKNINNNYFLISDYYLNIGNPNIYDIIGDVNSKLTNFMSCVYDKLKNYLIFYRLKAVDNNYHTMYIKPINSGSFFGLNNNVEYLITNNFQSIKQININTIQSINIVFSGISFKYNNIDNFRGSFTDSNLVLHQDVNVPKNALIQYDNYDANNNFCYQINNKSVNLIKITVFNQDYNIIDDFPILICKFNLQ